MSVTAFPAPFTAPAPARVAGRTMRLARIYFALLAAAGLAAFILGVTNRFTSGGLFGFPPPVDWLPPLSAERWARAYAVHQQDPIYAACGGTESLAEYQLLYGWEWLRQASLHGPAPGAHQRSLPALARAVQPVPGLASGGGAGGHSPRAAR